MATTVLGAPARWARQDLPLRRCGVVSVAALWLVGALDASDGSVGRTFEIAFVAVAVTAALAVEPAGRWSAALLPVPVLVASLGGLVVVRPVWVDVPGLSDDVGRLGQWFAAVLDHGAWMLVACAAALVVAAVLRPQPVTSST